MRRGTGRESDHINSSQRVNLALRSSRRLLEILRYLNGACRTAKIASLGRRADGRKDGKLKWIALFDRWLRGRLLVPFALLAGLGPILNKCRRLRRLRWWRPLSDVVRISPTELHGHNTAPLKPAVIPYFGRGLDLIYSASTFVCPFPATG